MALVHVIHRRLQAQRFQRAISADAEQNLLLQAHLQIAAVKLVGDVAILRAVGRQIGIQQIERTRPTRDPPDLGRDARPS